MQVTSVSKFPEKCTFLFILHRSKFPEINKFLANLQYFLKTCIPDTPSLAKHTHLTTKKGSPLNCDHNSRKLVFVLHYLVNDFVGGRASAYKMLQTFSLPVVSHWLRVQVYRQVGAFVVNQECQIKMCNTVNDLFSFWAVYKISTLVPCL